jgi:sulfatase modifying factor 1
MLDKKPSPCGCACMAIVAALVVVLFAVCGDLTPPGQPSHDDDSTSSIPHIRTGGMAKIAAAGKSFAMGQPNGNVNELPVHDVMFRNDFYMDSTEVTQRDYDTLMRIVYMEYTTPPWSQTYGKGRTYPAYLVNWYDAALYCNARSRTDSLDTVYFYDSIGDTAGNGCFLYGLAMNMSRNGYRLPTEAEWEYSCRGGTTTDYYWGASAAEDTAGQYAWYAENANSLMWGATHDAMSNGTQPVAGRKPNRFGLYDMIGNCNEWCQDYFTVDYYQKSAAEDPAGPPTGTKRILRGGSWRGLLSTCGRRNTQVPELRYNIDGFRTVRRAD